MLTCENYNLNRVNLLYTVTIKSKPALTTFYLQLPHADFCKKADAARQCISGSNDA